MDPEPEAAQKMCRQNNCHQSLPDAHGHGAHLSTHKNIVQLMSFYLNAGHFFSSTAITLVLSADCGVSEYDSPTQT